MKSAAAPATATILGTPAEAIPFRKTGGVSGPEVFSSFAITLLLLGAVAVAAWHARRKGWLNRWLALPNTAESGKRRLAVLEVLPLSRNTRLFLVRQGEQELLVVESTAGAVQLRPAHNSGDTK
jgi:hypothetical protein